jgi:hypothetical protein
MGAVRKTIVSINKAVVDVGASPPADLVFLALLLVIMVMGGDGCGTAQIESSLGICCLYTPMMFKWSASSEAPPWHFSFSLPTLIAEGWLSSYLFDANSTSTSMPTCQERWPCCFSMVFSIHLG